jgi:hypothetical protein
MSNYWNEINKVDNSDNFDYFDEIEKIIEELKAANDLDINDGHN